jgi:hypothetical protein
MKFDVREFFWKLVEKIRTSLKSDKNKGYITCRLTYIYGSISLNSSQNEKCFSWKLQIKSEHTFYVQPFSFLQIVPFMRQWGKIWVRQTTGVNTTRRMRLACCITKATDTYSQYVTLIAFPLQQWLRERASVLRGKYIAGFVRIFTFSQPRIRKGSRTRRQGTIYDPSVGRNTTDWTYVSILYPLMWLRL